MTAFTTGLISDFASVLASHGTSVTIYNQSSQTVDEEGDTTITWATSVSTTALIGELNYEERRLVTEGILHSGTLKLFITAATVLGVNDKVTINSKNWIVTSVKTVCDLDTQVFKIAMLSPQSS